MADQKRDRQDEERCECVNCQAHHQKQENKDAKQAACRANTGRSDQTCKVSDNKQQPSKQDERTEQHHQHAEAQNKHAGPESKDSKRHGKPDQGAHHTPSESGTAGVTPIAATPGAQGASNPAVGHGHSPGKPLDKQQSGGPAENEATGEGAKKTLQSKPESQPPAEQPPGSPRPTDEGARGASHATTAGGTKRTSESSELENDGKPSKQPKQDEQPKEEQQSGQRKSGEQQQQLKSEPKLADKPSGCTNCCPVHCNPENVHPDSNPDSPDDEPADSVSEQEPNRRGDRRNRAQRRRSSRGRQRSSPGRRPRARSAPRRRRSSVQRNGRRRR